MEMGHFSMQPSSARTGTHSTWTGRYSLDASHQPKPARPKAGVGVALAQRNGTRPAGAPRALHRKLLPGPAPAVHVPCSCPGPRPASCWLVRARMLAACLLIVIDASARASFSPESDGSRAREGPARGDMIRGTCGNGPTANRASHLWPWPWTDDARAAAAPYVRLPFASFLVVPSWIGWPELQPRDAKFTEETVTC